MVKHDSPIEQNESFYVQIVLAQLKQGSMRLETVKSLNLCGAFLLEQYAEIIPLISLDASKVISV